MDNLENILYSLLPLVLIIVFSWLFSYVRVPHEKTGRVGRQFDNTSRTRGRSL